MRVQRLLIALLVVLFGCTSKEEDPSWPPPAPEQGLQLKVGPYEVAPGAEIHKCVTYQVQDSMLVNRIESFSNGVSHHFAADVTIVPVPEGIHDCREIFTEEVMKNSMTVYSTDRAENRVDFPPGVAGKLPAKYARIILSYHFVNPTSTTKHVEGFLNLHTTQREGIHALINGIVGTIGNFEIPPRAEMTMTGTCEVDRPVDIVAMTGHAHQTLRSFELRVSRGGILPAEPDYTTAEWSGPPLDTRPDRPLHLEAGDVIEWKCNFANPTDQKITEGEKTSQEMCMAIVVYMPDQGFLTCNVSPTKPRTKVRQQTPPSAL